MEGGTEGTEGSTLLPLNIGDIYKAGSKVNVKVNLFGVGGGGHFEFSACPVHYPNVPTEDCFEKYPLEFVRDEYYGAVKDVNYPNRAYIPYESAFEVDTDVGDNGDGGDNGENDGSSTTPNTGGSLKPVYSSNLGPGGATMMEFSYTLKLPKGAQELNTDLVELESRGVPNANVEGRTYTEHHHNSGGANANHHHRTLQRQHRQQQQQGEGEEPEEEQEQQKYIATQTTGGVTVHTHTETVLISSLSTDGYGTTTIITLDGQVTIIKGGPAVGASLVETYGSKEIYGGGIEDILEDVLGDNTVGDGSLPSSQGGSSAASAFASGGGGGGGSSGSDDNADEGSSSSSSELSHFEEFLTQLPPNNGAPSSILVTDPVSASLDNNGDPNPWAATPDNPNPKYVLLRWHYITARDCHPEGYDDYPWPSEWGEWTPHWGGECMYGINGNQDEYWNCAEVLILSTGSSSGDDGGESESSGSGGNESGGDGDIYVVVDPFLPDERPIEPQSNVPIASAALPADQNAIFAKDDRAATIGTTPVIIDVIQNDTGEHLVVTGTRDGRHGSCEVTEGNRVVYVSAKEGFEGRDRCAYLVCLGDGGIEEEEICDEGWIYLQVNPPMTTTSAGGTIVAVDDVVITGSAQRIRIDVAANDVYTSLDPNADDFASSGTRMPVTTMEVTNNALHGTCQAVFASSNYPEIDPDNRKREVTYIPYGGFDGWDRCTYRICVEGGASSGPSGFFVRNEENCDEAQIKIKVWGSIVPEDNNGDNEEEEEEVTAMTNTPKPTPRPKPVDAVAVIDLDLNVLALSSWDPIANPDTVTVMEGANAYVDVLANDRDPEGDTLTLYSWTSPQSGGGNVEEVEPGVFSYTPSEGFTGIDSFKYTVCNSSDRCDTASVSVKVVPSKVVALDDDDDDEVFAEDDEATTFNTSPINVDVTANDSSSSNKDLVVTDVNKARHGMCEVAGNKVRYTPAPEFVGWDRCAYIVCSVTIEDGSGEDEEVCDKGRLEVQVLPSLNLQRPLPSPQTEDLVEEIVKPTDPTVTGLETIDLALHITPDEQKVEEITSEDKGTSDGDFALEMVYAEDEIVTTALDTPVIVDVTSNDFVKGMGPLYVTRAGGATDGSCKVTRDNRVKYVPGDGFVGQDHCAYVVCHGDGSDGGSLGMCDEGIIGIKVTTRKVAKKELLQQQKQQAPVSNHESSNGLSLESASNGLSRQSAFPPRAGQSSSGMHAAAAVHCKDEGDGRNLRGGGDKLGRRKLPKNAHCQGSSLVSTAPATKGNRNGDDDGDDAVITYTSTYHKKAVRSSNSSPGVYPRTTALRSGRTASSNPANVEKSESYVDTVITIPASGDADIMPSFPDKCFGKTPSMIVSGPESRAGVHEALLQFQTSGVDTSICDDGNGGSVISGATVFLYSLSNSRQSGTFVTTSVTSWDEETVTWNTAPSSDGIVFASQTSEANPLDAVVNRVNEWHGVDVSSALIWGDTLSIRILSNQGASSVARYASREHSDGRLAPMLNVTCVSMLDDAVSSLDASHGVDGNYSAEEDDPEDRLVVFEGQRQIGGAHPPSRNTP